MIPSHVTLVEVGPRDGLQNEAQPVNAEHKVELVHRLQAFLWSIVETHNVRTPPFKPANQRPWTCAAHPGLVRALLTLRGPTARLTHRGGTGRTQGRCACAVPLLHQRYASMSLERFRGTLADAIAWVKVPPALLLCGPAVLPFSRVWGQFGRSTASTPRTTRASRP